MGIDDIVKRAMTQRRSLLLEKTLFDSGHVLEYARRFAAEGCRTHLLGTHITPLQNWEFLSNRMSWAVLRPLHLKGAGDHLAAPVRRQLAQYPRLAQRPCSLRLDPRLRRASEQLVRRVDAR